MFYEKGIVKNFARFTGKHRCWSLFYNDVAERDPDTCFWWNFKICKIFFEGRLQPSGSRFQKRYLPEHLKELDSEFIEAVTRGVLWKKVLLEISQNSQENTCVRVSFLIKLQAWGLKLIKKETLAQVFSCEFYEVSKNTFFIEYFWWLLLYFYNPRVGISENCKYSTAALIHDNIESGHPQWTPTIRVKG